MRKFRYTKMEDSVSQRHMYIGASRLLCDVLEDMRQCDKSKSYGSLAGLIEEAQVIGNRMESGLGDVKKIKEIEEQKRKYKKEIRELEETLSELDDAIENSEKRLEEILFGKKKAECLTPGCTMERLNDELKLCIECGKKALEKVKEKHKHIDIKA